METTELDSFESAVEGLLAPAENDDVEEALKKAEVIITEIENGLSFKEAQKNYSSLFDNDQNGSLGWRTRSQIPTLFSKKIQF